MKTKNTVDEALMLISKHLMEAIGLEEGVSNNHFAFRFYNNAMKEITEAIKNIKQEMSSQERLVYGGGSWKNKTQNLTRLVFPKRYLADGGSEQDKWMCIGFNEYRQELLDLIKKEK